MYYFFKLMVLYFHSTLLTVYLSCIVLVRIFQLTITMLPSFKSYNYTIISFTIKKVMPQTLLFIAYQINNVLFSNVILMKAMNIFWAIYSSFLLAFICILFCYIPHGRNTATRRHSRGHRKCLADSFSLH